MTEDGGGQGQGGRAISEEQTTDDEATGVPSQAPF